MKKIRCLVAISLIVGSISETLANPSDFTIRSAASDAGCSAISPDIRLVSESNGYPTQYVYQVECDSLQDTYIIVVCEGSFDCSPR